MQNFQRVCFLAIIATLFTISIGCTGAKKQVDTSYQFPMDRQVGAATSKWFQGDDELAVALTDNTSKHRAEDIFVAAEATFWSGDVERAFKLYARLLSERPYHPLSRFAAARLHDLHDDVVDFHERVRPILRPILYGKTHPLTASYLSMIGQRVAWRDWYVSDATTPFEANAQGLPLRWMVSPRMSLYRLGDFDTPFAPETQKSLAPTYLSPAYAEEHPSNIEESEPYVASNINLSPPVKGSGVYYLESFATVESDTDEVYWLFSNSAGAMKIWIDGEEVVTRRESDYGTGKRWRRVKLSPGTHRILVKLAYQSNYRDWFDLNFLNPDASAIGGSKISFRESLADGAEANGTIAFLSEVKKPSQLEPVMVSADEVEGASDMTLYLTALAANYDRQPEFFTPAMDELIDRNPAFAPAHGLKSAQLQTLWEVPSKLRDASSLSELRTAHELDPDSLYYTMRLGAWLKNKGKDREVRELLEEARDASISGEGEERRLRNIKPLNTWASYLEEQGWDEPSERAWRAALEIAPSNCTAASKLQSIRFGRRDYVTPEALTPRADSCPPLRDAWIKAQPEAYDEKLAIARRDAARYPYNSTRQVALARALIDAGQHDEARALLETTLEKNPDSLLVYDELADLALSTQDADAARAWIDRAVARVGNSGWAVWRAATLGGEIPLQDLLQDGPALARKLGEAHPVKPPGASAEEGSEEAASEPAPAPSSPPETSHSEDEAYYAIDFAATRYYEDGSSITITHTMSRVMTKSAIDRYAEVSLPDDARVLFARTVKQDGSTVVPEQTSGKDTLSMPGLAPGDFVELAYLQYDSPESVSHTRRDGTRFFFKMADISSLRSEFIVINPVKTFVRRNDAPEPEAFTYDGMPAVRFLRTDSPRPRNEPYSVGSDEYLPWIQMVAQGTRVPNFELGRRTWRETLQDSLKMSAQVKEQFKMWLLDARVRVDPKSEGARDRLVKDLFYQVNAYYTSHSNSLSQDISHGILTREGNALLTLYMLYKKLGFSVEIYLAKDLYATPEEHPLHEVRAYTNPLLYLKMPDSGAEQWVTPNDQDAMFGALGDSVRGQPAICITCDEASEKTIPLSSPLARYDQRDMDIEATLAPDGTLQGTTTQVYDGPSAVYGRKLLRQQTEQTKREKFVEALVTEHIPGATVTDYKILNAENPDEELTFIIEFEREQFARVDGNDLIIQAALFRQPLASIYGTLSARAIPLMVGRARHYDDAITVRLPEGMSPVLGSKAGAWTLDTGFGAYTREVNIEDGVLTVAQKIDVPIQRVMPEKYNLFQQWAIAIEQSSILLLKLSK